MWKLKGYPRSMLRTLGMIALGLIVFLAAFSIFISAHVLSVRLWQFTALITSVFTASFVVAAINPRRVWEHAPAVVVGGVTIVFVEGVKRFLDREPAFLIVFILTGLAAGILGAWVGRLVFLKPRNADDLG